MMMRSMLARLVLYLIVITVVLLATPTRFVLAQATPPASSSRIDLSAKITNLRGEPQIGINSEAIVTITAKGVVGNCPVAPLLTTITPGLTITDSLDVMLVIDQTAEARRFKIDDYFSTLKASLRADRDLVGVTTFNASATGGNVKTQLKKPSDASFASAPEAAGSAFLFDGLNKGLDALLDFSARKDAVSGSGNRALIIVSAGTIADISDLTSKAEGQTLLNRIRTSGVRLIIVALGRTTDEANLKTLLQSPLDAVLTTSNDGNQINTLFRTNIPNLLRPKTAATNLELTFNITNPNYPLQSDEAVSSGGTVSADKKTLKWTFSNLVDRQELSVTAVLKTPNTLDAVGLGQINLAYQDCQGVARIASIAIPALSLQLPTPTATLPPTITPIPPSPTIEASATPLFGVGVSPPTVRQTTLAPVSFGTQFCDGVFGLIRYLLLPLSLLFIAFLIWFFLLRGSGRGYPLVNDVQVLRRCSLAALLSLLWMGLVLALVLGPLLGRVCQPQDSVYFWRYDKTSSTSGIYLTSLEGSNQPIPFTTVNERRCVGCHTVSSSGNVIAAIEHTNKSDPYELLLYKLTGEQINTQRPISAHYVSFNPDGTKLALSDKDLKIKIYDIATSTLTELEGANDPTVVQTMPTWGTTGKIAFVRSQYRDDVRTAGLAIAREAQIYMIPETGGKAEPLLGASEADTLQYYPAYSPDGKWLAFTRAKGGTGEYTLSNNNAEIYNVAAAGGPPIRLTLNEGDTKSNSWPSWSRDGRYLTFNTKRADPSYDIYVATINAEGQSSNGQPLRSAAQFNTFEHTAFWGPPISQPPLTPADFAGLLWLLPALLIFGLAPRLCKDVQPVDEIPTPPDLVFKKVEVPPYTPPVLWEAQPTLILGAGQSGRWILTHIKKNLRDASAGKIPGNIRFLSVATGNLRRIRTLENPLIHFAGVQLADEELIDLNQDLSGVLQRKDLSTDPTYREWVDAGKLRAGGVANVQLAQSTGMQRTLARIGFVEHLRGNRDTDDQGNPIDLTLSLKEAMKAAIDPQGGILYVVIAGSIADDGGAHLLDLVYLVRKYAAEMNIRALNISGHFATDNAINQQQGDQRPSRVNAQATLRELERFQRIGSDGISQSYNVKELDGKWLGNPFDLISLYDGDKIGINSPETTVYPAIADIVSVSLDRAARRGAWQRVQNEISTTQINAQDESQSLLVRSVGTYQYRLPYMDIVDALRKKFGAKLITQLVMGPAGSDRALDADQVGKDFILEQGETAKALAYAFFTRKLPAPRDVLDWIRPTWRLFAKSTPSAMHREAKACVENDAKYPDKDAFITYLDQIVELLLNGKTDHTRNLKRTLDFLTALLPLIDAVRQGIPEYADVMDRLEQRCKFLKASLQTQLDLIGVTGQESDTVYGRLRTGAEMGNIRNQMDAIQSRKLIWTQPDERGKSVYLADHWYENYLVGKDQERLTQLRWSVSQTEGVQLVVLANSEIALTKKGLTEFIEGVYNLTDRSISQVKADISLSSLLAAEELHPDKVENTARVLSEQSGAMLSFNPTDAPQYQGHRVILANKQTQNLDKIRAELVRRSNSDPTRVVAIETTDPYSIGVLESVAVIPLAAIPSLKSASDAYKAEYGLDDPQTRNRPIITAVYTEDALTLLVEQDLHLIRQEHRTLHPTIVSGFASLRAIQVFSLALASGDIDVLKRDGIGQKGEVKFNEDRLVEISANDAKHPLVKAYQAICTEYTDAELAQHYGRYLPPDSDLQKWVDSGWTDFNDDPGDQALQDLLSVVRITVRQHIQK
jgi:hypothetical protein